MKKFICFILCLIIFILNTNTACFAGNSANVINASSTNTLEQIGEKNFKLKRYKVVSLLGRVNDSTYYLVTENDMLGVADSRGNLIVPCKYKKISGLNVIIFQNDGFYGAYDLNGKIIIPAKYDEIHLKNSKNFLVKYNNKFGIFSIDGQQLLPFKYDNIIFLSDENVILNQNSQYFFYDLKTKKRNLLDFDKIISLSQHSLIVEKNNKSGVYDISSNNYIIHPKFDNIKRVNNHYIVTLKDKKGLYFNNGIEILKPIYKNISMLRYNYYKIEKNNGKFDYTFVDNDKPVTLISDVDEITDKKRWEKLNTNDCVYLPVKKSGKYGIVSYNEKQPVRVETVLPFEYDEINSSFSFCIATKPLFLYKIFFLIKKDNKYGLFDIEQKKLVTNIEYDGFVKLGYTNYMKVLKNGKYAIYDVKKEKFSNFEYDDIKIGKIETEFTGQNIQLKKNGIWYYRNPAKIAGTALAYTGFYTLVIATLPLTIPLAILVGYGIYVSCKTTPHPKEINIFEKCN